MKTLYKVSSNIAEICSSFFLPLSMDHLKNSHEKHKDLLAFTETFWRKYHANALFRTFDSIFMLGTITIFAC